MAEPEPSRRPEWRWSAAAALVAAVMLGQGIASSGLWDPYELDRAELARRIAVQLFRAGALVADPGREAMPTLGDLGMGELPFTSMAAGFAVFGLEDWAGRLPLVLWALFGAFVLHRFLARRVGGRAPFYGVLALCTMPLYFVQAHTMIGDGVTMVCFALASLGGLAALEAEGHARVAWLAVFIAGLVGGYLCRGAILGVALPALGVGAAWLVAMGAKREKAVDARVGSLCLLVGLGSLAWGLGALVGVEDEVRRAVGFLPLAAPPRAATFDLSLRQLGHALFPWSAFLPFACGRLLGGAPEGRAPLVRGGLCTVLAVAYAGQALLEPQSGSIPFLGVVPLAAVAGIVLDDLERDGRASRLVAGATLLLGLVLYLDLTAEPKAALAAHGLDEAVDAAALGGFSQPWLTPLTAVFLGGAFLVWLDGSPFFAAGALGRDGLPARAASWARGRIEAYEAAARELAEQHDGNLAFGALVIEAGLIGVGGILLVGHRLGWASVVTLPRPLLWIGLNLWWSLPLAMLFVPLVLDLLRGGLALLLEGLGVGRGTAMAVVALSAGGMSGFGYYAALGERLSPKGVFATYGERGAGQPLGLLGVSSRASRYYARGAPVVALSNPREAIRWLTRARSRPEPEQRWLAFFGEDLPELNALFRQTEGVNLPVHGRADGEVLLASSLSGGAPNDNPLEPFVLSAPPPRIQHPVQGTFGRELSALGWEIRDEENRLVDVVVAGRRYRMTFYFRVIAPLRRDYSSFIHIDGQGRRHNGDHAPLGGHYGTTLWRAGDVIADPYDLELEPNFTRGDYRVHFGFFIRKQRLEVTSGEGHDDRLYGGVLAVR
ncbi:MAG: glycosyltransferase family 39 protein [Polyangiaceae bacterium]